ncbi:hypothetical protein Tco_1466351 [Tanacetum coccineum]
MYLVFSHMLKSFDMEDLETLWKLVKAKHGSTRPEEGYERVLWGNLKTMFDPHVEDTIWRNQQDYRVLDWKIFDSCGVHSLRMQHMHIHMLVEKRYLLTPATITDMLNKKLQCDHFNEMLSMKKLEILKKNIKFKGGLLGLKYFLMILELLLLRKARLLEDKQIPTFGKLLEDIHVTWTHLGRNGTRLQLYNEVVSRICSQSLETASQFPSDTVRTYKRRHQEKCDGVRIGNELKELPPQAQGKQKSEPITSNPKQVRPKHASMSDGLNLKYENRHSSIFDCKVPSFSDSLPKSQCKNSRRASKSNSNISTGRKGASNDTQRLLVLKALSELVYDYGLNLRESTLVCPALYKSKMVVLDGIRIENLDGKMDQQVEISKLIRSEVNDAREDISQIGYDLDSLNQLVSFWFGSVVEAVLYSDGVDDDDCWLW